jgi:O-antigen/teichoic acid export membrane protein
MRVLIIGPFTTAWAPFLWSVSKKDNAKEIYSKILTYFFLVSMFVALGLSSLSKEVITIMTTSSYHDAYLIVPIIALSYVLYGCYFILFVGINLKKKTKYQPFIVGFGAIINLILNFLFIPKYGMYGAAIATLISYLTLPITTHFISKKIYPIEYEWIRLIKIFLISLFIFIICLLISIDSVIISGFIKTILIIVSYPSLLYIFRFFRKDEKEKIKQLIKDNLHLSILKRLKD